MLSLNSTQKNKVILKFRITFDLNEAGVAACI